MKNSLYALTLVLALFGARVCGGNVSQKESSQNDKAESAQTESSDKRALKDYEISEDALPKKARKIFENVEELSIAAVNGEWVLVKDEELKSKTLHALYEGIANPAQQDRCFIPHHKLRASSGGETIELLICFHCHNFSGKFSDGNEFGGAISEVPKEIFDRIIESAKPPAKN